MAGPSYVSFFIRFLAEAGSEGSDGVVCYAVADTGQASDCSTGRWSWWPAVDGGGLQRRVPKRRDALVLRTRWQACQGDRDTR